MKEVDVNITMFKAKIILDSINSNNGIRLVTSELTYPRFIHAEFMTHRMFSRNAASSRAIPARKMIDMIRNDPATPVFWGKNKRGMCAKGELEGYELELAKELWLHDARDRALHYAERLRELGLHKQLLNRILEPWKWITVICSATEFSNFFALRDHEDAQPEIQHLACLWKVAFDNSIPLRRATGEWHIPYIQDDEQDLPLETRQKMGVARCARVSYLTHDGVRSVDKDLVLYERLLTGSGHGHWSPFEHVAQATSLRETRLNFKTWENETGPIWCGNFQGWIQYRKLHIGECQ